MVIQHVGLSCSYGLAVIRSIHDVLQLLKSVNILLFLVLMLNVELMLTDDHRDGIPPERSRTLFHSIITYSFQAQYSCQSLLIICPWNTSVWSFLLQVKFWPRIYKNLAGFECCQNILKCISQHQRCQHSSCLAFSFSKIHIHNDLQKIPFSE